MPRDYSLCTGSPDHAVPPSGIDYAQELNAQQLAAVTSQVQHALVIAGAGSGKTRTLIYRVAWLLDQGISPREILLLTFTNKAAKEMIERVRLLVAQDLYALWGGTFHSIAFKILRMHATEIGYKSGFTIIDTEDRRTLLRSLIGEHIDGTVANFPKPDVLGNIFSLADNMGVSIARTMADSFSFLESHLFDIERLYDFFKARKLEINAMDFDDLLTNVVRLLNDCPHLRDIYQNRFRHILVDEYQDTNQLQSQFIKLLAGERGNLMVVGDDAQSIYSWRGANLHHILNFEKTYTQPQVYKIETNYRSLPAILEVSNAAISCNVDQIPKVLRANRNDPFPSLPALVSLNNPYEQADFIVKRVKELHDSGTRWRDIAALYRAHHHSMDLQMALQRAGIPFIITSGIRFFEQAHIKDVLAYLRFLSNPQDELAYKRIVQMFNGVGPIAAQKLWETWRATESYQNSTTPVSFYSTLKSTTVPKKARDDWDQFLNTLDKLTPNGTLIPHGDMFDIILEDGGYADVATATFENADQRLEDIATLAGFASKFDDLHAFIAELSLYSNTDDTKPASNDDALILSTIHQAKGLEWNTVFLLHLCEGQFPHQRVLESCITEGDSALEEERRLFYVAITRAKDNLYILYPKYLNHGPTGIYPAKPSRFIDEIPPHLLEEWRITYRKW